MFITYRWSETRGFTERASSHIVMLDLGMKVLKYVVI